MYFESERTMLPDGVVNGDIIDISWLKSASPEEQHEALFQWFTNQYEDPVESLPYDSREGGYIPIHGALVDPSDEFGGFTGIVSDKIINDVVEELYNIAGDSWSPVNKHEDYYDSDDSAFSAFELRISRALKLLDLNDDFLIKASVFSLLFTAFETYLWEKVKYCLRIKEIGLERSLIENMQEFKQKKSLAEFYNLELNIKSRLNDILDKETVWHNIKTINLVFKEGFQLETLPDFTNIQKALDIRHNIVHRFGMNIDGYEIPLKYGDILELKEELISYVKQLEQYIERKFNSHKI